MKNLVAVSSLLFSALPTPCLCGKIYQNLAELPAPKKVYDFVVVGGIGGTAGLVVAHRLAEDKTNSVLVIEAGGTNADDISLQVPAYYVNALGTKFDWNYASIPQSGLNNRSVAYALGHVLGGSSSISGGAYTRGPSEMYDKIAKVTGDDGWSWKNLIPYILRNERLTPPVDGHDPSKEVDSSVHGHSGLVGDSVYNYPSAADSKVRAATEELQHEFPFIRDMNDGQLGVGYQLSTIRNGTHENSATAYLRPSFVKEHNIDIVLNTLATRIVPDAPYPGSQGLKFRTVEVSGSQFNATSTVPPGPRIMFAANKEIIISAGAIHTPQFLMLSGIGPRAHLDSMGIPIVIDNPSVGDRFTDHTALQIAFYTNESFPSDSDRLQWLKQWNETRTGPLTTTNTNMRGHFRMTEKELAVFKRTFRLPDPAPGNKASHYELIFLVCATNELFTGASFGIMISDMNPRSYGQIRLNSTDPYASPLIDPNLLDEESDVYVLRAGYRAARRFLNATTFKGYLMEPVGNVTLPDSDNSKGIDELVRSGVFSMRHPSGTAAMSRRGDKEGVVDPDLKLKGAGGVRIVDTSVFPFLPGAHTQTPVYIIAERAADLIKKEGGNR